jgi:glycosyltransferase involved in cell wall biosynthesis
MKVVIAHNRYQSGLPSGENRVVDSEIALLRAAGIDVVPFFKHSDDIVGGTARVMMRAAPGPVISPGAVREFNALIETHRPDILHVHNVFPLISPWVIRAAVKARIPVVQTVHNYRHTCVAGMHTRNGATCEDCRNHVVPWPAVKHACYRGSAAQSGIMAIGQMVHKSTWRMVSRFLITSPQMRDRLESTGVRASRIEWRPTFAEDAGITKLQSDGGIAFVGRLDQAKGIELLLRAWTPKVAQRWKRLVIAGDGPLAGRVAAAAEADSSVEWRGHLDPEGVRAVIRGANLVAIPSLWFEGFPHVAAEAMSIGRPLLMWSGAGFSRLADADAGWQFDGTPDAWTKGLLDVDDASLRRRSASARKFYERRCSPAMAVQQLQDVYVSVASRGSE